MIHVVSEVRDYSGDGPFDDRKLIVRSCLFDDRVVLELVGGKPITVLARDLVDAVTNATRTGAK